jgi:hypothetical protein
MIVLGDRKERLQQLFNQVEFVGSSAGQSVGAGVTDQCVHLQRREVRDAERLYGHSSSGGA